MIPNANYCGTCIVRCKQCKECVDGDKYAPIPVGAKKTWQFSELPRQDYPWKDVPDSYIRPQKLKRK